MWNALNVASRTLSFQTAMYLTPKDLLQLSRLSKQFRSMFASRSALFVWQTVYRNVDLKCFEDINEIQLASLLYDICCMVAFSPFLYHIDYTYMILFLLNVPFRHADVSRRDAWYIPCFVWDYVHAVKLRSKFIYLFKIYYSRILKPSWFFFFWQSCYWGWFAGSISKRQWPNLLLACFVVWVLQAGSPSNDRKVFIFERRKVSRSFYSQYGRAHQS